MHVASEKQNRRSRSSSRSSSRSAAGLMREPLLLRYPANFCPTAEHFLAIIPTKWGVCGVVWKYHEAGGESASGFAEKPCNALLCRLVPPGMTVGELRKGMMGEYVLCNEVLVDEHGGFHPEVVPDWFPELVRYVQSYYANALRDSAEAEFVDRWQYWRSRLDWSSLTEFQRKVLELVAQIERGTRKTYGEIAKLTGKPQASRAVGAALGANPWPVLIPCHRVVGAGGKMTGFSAPGGVKTKERMLAMETRIQ
jgi:O-6-methylguanine DNA methyltransferase